MLNNIIQHFMSGYVYHVMHCALHLSHITLGHVMK